MNDFTKRRPPATRAFVRLPSGLHFDLINPISSQWYDSDLAIRLSRVARWTGESCWPNSLSVAQHSLLVMAIRIGRSSTPLSPQLQLAELCHDMDEALLGVDLPSPIVTLLGDAFHDLRDRLMHAIRRRYKIPTWSAEEYRLHKEADIIAAASEAVHCVGWTPMEVREVLRIDHEILERDPLAALFGCRPWEPWPAEVAAARFQSTLASLLEKIEVEAKVAA